MARMFLATLLGLLCWMSPAFAATNYYVDPDWAGTKTGAPSTPWTSLDSGAWSAINNALAAGDVTVYFSARAAGSDVNQVTTTSVDILRTNGSTNRLTLDGMSQYNANDGAPTWLPYSGTSKFQITAQYPMGTGNSSGGPARNYITVRGFKPIGTGASSQAAFFANINHWIIEFNDISNAPNASSDSVALMLYTSTSEPGPAFPSAGFSPAVRGTFGTDVIVRNNTIHDCRQECLYVGGYYNTGGPASILDVAFTDLLIENNTIYNAGRASEGNAIDVKGGQKNLIIRGNTITVPNPTTFMSGAILVENCAVIEQNFVSGHSNGITLGPAENSLVGRNGCEVRYNVLVGNTATGGFGDFQSGIELREVYSGNATYRWTNTKVYNNTVYGNPAGLNNTNGATGHTNVTVQNNIFAENTIQVNSAAGLIGSHTNNVYRRVAGGTLVANGSASYSTATLGSFEPSALSVDPQFVSTAQPYLKDNFRLKTISPLAGLNIGAFPGGAPPPPPPPQTFTLTTSVVGQGTITGGASYSAGTVVTVTATPAAGWQFSGWSGACSGTGGCVVTMDANKAVTATFTAVPPPPPPPPPPGVPAAPLVSVRCAIRVTGVPPDALGGWAMQLFNGTSSLSVAGTSTTRDVFVQQGTYSLTAKWTKTGEVTQISAVQAGECK